jgi:ubiquinone/menaquinone biosynthesis C-methylase UbiE
MRTIEPARLGLAAGDRVLDVGCGDGRHMHAAAEETDVDVVGVDLDTDRLRSARADYEQYVAGEHDGAFEVAAADALGLPFPDGAFDAVVCSEVLEHVPDYESAIDELERVLAPGGVLAVSFPRYGPERVCWALSEAYHQTPGGHVRIFCRATVKKALSDRGLDFEGRAFAHALHAPYWWLKCLWWERRDEDQPLPLALYERVLEYDVLNEPRVTRALEERLNPVLGKSVVFYFENPGTSSEGSAPTGDAGAEGPESDAGVRA